MQEQDQNSFIERVESKISLKEEVAELNKQAGIGKKSLKEKLALSGVIKR